MSEVNPNYNPQADEWKQWGIKYLRENLKINKKMAENEMLWFNLQYGLTYSGNG